MKIKTIASVLLLNLLFIGSVNATSKSSHQELLQDYEIALKKNINDAMYWVALGHLLINVGELDKSIKSFKKALSFKPNGRTQSRIAYGYVRLAKVYL